MANLIVCPRSSRSSFTVLLAALALATTALAQAPAATAPATSDNSESQDLQEIVVTGNVARGGLKKLDVSYSVTTLSDAEMKEANTTSANDLLKASPGVHVESSGGQSGANIEVAGFPGSSGSPFVTIALNGAPVFPQSGLAYLEQGSLLRLDDTIERAELVQGGPGVLYGNGQPGLFANFILKRGTETPTGDVGVTYGSEGLVRLDGFGSFPIGTGTGWYGSIGGFWRESDGIRDPQYKADLGGQLTATVTREWDKGSLMLYSRYVNDKNQFVTDTPILNPSAGKFSAYPGFSALTGTMGSKADQHEFLQTTPCSTPGCTPGGIQINMADGRGPAAQFSGADFDWDFGNGWTLSDKFGFSSGTQHMVAFYSGGTNPTPLASYIANAETADGLPAGLVATANYANNGPAASMTQNVLTQELRDIHETFQATSNELHISYELFPGNTLTLGNYTAFSSADLLAIQGSDILLQAQSNPNPIAISLTNGTNTWQLTSPQGFTSGPTTANSSRGTGFNTAFILSDSWKLDQWLFDAGVREEHQHISAYHGNFATGDLDDNAYTLYNNKSRYLVAGQSDIYFSNTVPSWTAGANYAFTPNMSAYARANNGVHFPSITDLTSNPAISVEQVHNMEVGFKYENEWVYTTLSAFRRLFYGVPVSGLLVAVGNTTEVVSYTYGSEANGLDFQTVVKPFENFSVTLSGDYQDSHYTHSSGCFTFEGATTQTVCNPSYSFDGKQLARQPDIQFRLTPAYTLPTAWGALRAWVTYEYIGRHFGDQLEQQPLGHYYDLAFGLVADVGKNWEFRVQGTNVTDQIGITEGNARVLIGSGNTGGVVLARSIEGREVNIQAKYKF